MLSQPVIAVVSIICFSRLIKAIPTSNLPSPYPDSVLYSWSSEPGCATTAKQSDCTTAFTSASFLVCPGRPRRKRQHNCGRLYGLVLILTASIGGALGYNSSKLRTNDPLYAIYPKDGNANCLKAAGDTSPVLAMNALPGGGTLPTCPVSTSRRRRALEFVERQEQTNGEEAEVGCGIEDIAWSLGCTAVCLATITATSWITGPFAVAGWLACLGGCSGTEVKVFNNCQKAKGNTELLPLPFRERELVEEPNNPCLIIKQWSFSCPAQETSLLKARNCQQTTVNT
ncbi:hypothetical protein BDR22DRAFT_826151 [Usnea florida]